MMLSKVSGFDWDDGNREKCQKHGLSLADIEQFLCQEDLAFGMDHAHSETEERFLAIGKTDCGRYMLVAFTFRMLGKELRVRPISARYMHRKEVRRYEKEAAEILQ